MPKSASYIDPQGSKAYKEFVEFESYEEIKTDILSSFGVNCILKKNRGSQGRNVFICKTANDIQSAIERIYNKTSRQYDHVLLAQEYVTFKHEFRVLVFNRRILLIYEKDVSNAKFVGNVSPLHWEGAKAVIVKDNELSGRIDTFITPVYEKLDIQYGGFDIGMDDKGYFWLIEINTQPGYNLLVRDNGEEVLIDLYRQILNGIMTS